MSKYAIFNDQSFNDTLTNDIVSFEQLGPAHLQAVKAQIKLQSLLCSLGLCSLLLYSTKCFCKKMKNPIHLV